MSSIGSSKLSECRISVIIPVRNMEDKISQCLDAVLRQTCPPYEVIVVDGHSSDNTVRNALDYNIKILYEEYGTRAGANQIGIINAQGDFIAFTDADCIPKADWLENLLNEINNNDNDIIGVGGCVKNVGDTVWVKSINLTQNTFLGAANSIQGRAFSEKKWVNSISGCNSLYRKSDLLKVGGFDINLPTAEDTELNKRLSNHGRLLYVPDAVVIHDHGRGIFDFAKRMKQYGYGRAESLLLDLQVIPPILALISIVMLFVNFNIFIYFLIIYFLLIFLFTLKIFMKNTKLIFLITLPIVYLIEHIFYTIGFWKGISSRIFRVVL